MKALTLVLAVIAGVVSYFVAAWVARRTDSIPLGVLALLLCFVVAVLVLAGPWR